MNKDKDELTKTKLDKLSNKKKEEVINQIVTDESGKKNFPAQNSIKKIKKILDGNENEKNFSMEDIEESSDETSS